jgi:hypothetical protein
MAVTNPLTEAPLKVVYLHSESSKPKGVPCSTHYGLSAGLVADRTKKLEKETLRQSPYFQHYVDELKAWTDCYNRTWKKACQEIAGCFNKVQAFLVLPSNRTGMRDALIQAFSTAHPDAMNLSDLLGKAPDAVFGNLRDVKAVMGKLIVNDARAPNLQNLKSMLLVDDWFGTGTTMFAVQARVAELAGRPIALECAVPGVAQDQEYIKKQKKDKDLAAALLRDAGFPTKPVQEAT